MYRAVLAALLAIGVVANAHASPITYDIQSYLPEQSGWSLSGDITTDGTLGPITAANIISWEFTNTMGGTTVTHGLTVGSAIVTGTLLADATSLTLPIPVDPDTEENALQLGNGFFDFPLIEWARGNTGAYPVGDWYHSRSPGIATYWSDNVPTGSLPLPTADEPFIIATVVPEPGSLTLVLLGAGGLGLLIYRRRKRA